MPNEIETNKPIDLVSYNHLLVQLQNKSPDEAINLIRQALRQLLRSVLNLPDGFEFNDQQNFLELGIDFVIISQFKNRITEIFNGNISLNRKLIYSNPTVEKLADAILQLVLNPDKPTSNECLDKTCETKWFPLSIASQFLQWIGRASVGNWHLFINIEFSGNLNIPALSQALNLLIIKHPMLRASISTFFPKQKINPPQEISLETLDLRNLNEKDQLRELKSFSEKEIGFESHIKLGFRLFQLKENYWILILKVPHIVFDIASSFILLDDLKINYESIISEADKTKLNEPLYGYLQYIKEEQQTNQIELNQHINFWTSYLTPDATCWFDEKFFKKKNVQAESQTEGLTKNLDTIAQFIQDREGNGVFPLSDTTLNNLFQFCKDQKLGINMGVISILSLAIHVINNQTKLFMKYINSGRPESRYEKIIGSFAQLRYVKLEIVPKSTLKDHFQKIKQDILKPAKFNNQVFISFLAFSAITLPSMLFFIVRLLLSTLIFSKAYHFNKNFKKFLWGVLRGKIIPFNKDAHKNQPVNQKNMTITANVFPSLYQKDFLPKKWDDINVNCWPVLAPKGKKCKPTIWMDAIFYRDCNNDAWADLSLSPFTDEGKRQLANAFVEIINYLDQDNSIEFIVSKVRNSIMRSHNLS